MSHRVPRNMHINFTGIAGSLKSPQKLLGNLKKDLKSTLNFLSFFHFAADFCRDSGLWVTCNPHKCNGEMWVSGNSYITLFFLQISSQFLRGFKVTSNPRKCYMHVTGYPMRHEVFLYFLWGEKFAV